MKKSFKTLGVALALCLVFALGACSGSGTLSGKYDSVVSMNGYSTIVYKDGFQRVVKNGRLTGDKAYSITQVGKGEYFIARKSADSGYALMNSKGKFISKFETPAITALTGNYREWEAQDKDGDWTPDAELNYLVATLDVSKQTDAIVKANNMAIMKPDGTLLADRYSSISASGGQIAIATKEAKDGDDTKTEWYALKPDGTVIGTKSDFMPASYILNLNEIVFFMLSEPDSSGNIFAVYAHNGNKITNATGNYSKAGDNHDDTFIIYVKTDGVEEKHFINKDYTLTKHADYIASVFDYKSFSSNIIEGKPDGSSVALKKLDGTAILSGYKDITAYKDVFDVEYQYFKLTASDDKVSYALCDGTKILEGLDKNANISFAAYNLLEDDYGYIVQDGNTLRAKICGVDRTKSLEDGEIVSLYAEYGYAVIRKGSEYKVWMPYTDATVSVTGAPSSSNTVFSVTVKKNDNNYYYRALLHDVKWWDGSITKGNLLASVGGLSEAQLEVSKFIGNGGIAPALTLIDSSSLDLNKMKTYRIGKEFITALAKEVLNMGVMYAYSATYTLSDENAANRKNFRKDFIAYGVADTKTSFEVMSFEEGVRASSVYGPLAVVKTVSSAAYPAAFPDISTVYRLNVGNNGKAELKEIVSGLYNAYIGSDALLNYYIYAEDAIGRDMIYSEYGKLMLKGGSYYVSDIQNYVAKVSYASGSLPYGAVKLNKNGSSKLIAKVENYSLSLFIDGSFSAKANVNDQHTALYSNSGKKLEDRVLSAGSMNLLDEYNYDRVFFGGKKEIVHQCKITLAEGKSRVYTVKITESMLNCALYSIF